MQARFRGEAVVGGEEAGLGLGAAADGGHGAGGRGEQHGPRELARDGGASHDAEAHRARRLLLRHRRG